MLEHPDIGWIERNGYHSLMQEGDTEDYDEDRLYDERRERELFGE